MPPDNKKCPMHARLPENLAKIVREIAEKERNSFNGVVVRLVEKGLKVEGRKAAA